MKTYFVYRDGFEGKSVVCDPESGCVFNPYVITSAPAPYEDVASRIIGPVDDTKLVYFSNGSGAAIRPPPDVTEAYLEGRGLSGREISNVLMAKQFYDKFPDICLQQGLLNAPGDATKHRAVSTGEVVTVKGGGVMGEQEVMLQFYTRVGPDGETSTHGEAMARATRKRMAMKRHF